MGCVEVRSALRAGRAENVLFIAGATPVPRQIVSPGDRSPQLYQVSTLFHWKTPRASVSPLPSDVRRFDAPGDDSTICHHHS